MSKFVLYGTTTDGPYLVEVEDSAAESFAEQVHGGSYDSVDAALQGWRDRDQVAAPDVLTDPAAPQGEAPEPASVGDPLDAPTTPSQTPTESSPSADQS